MKRLILILVLAGCEVEQTEEQKEIHRLHEAMNASDQQRWKDSMRTMMLQTCYIKYTTPYCKVPLDCDRLLIECEASVDERVSNASR